MYNWMQLRLVLAFSACFDVTCALGSLLTLLFTLCGKPQLSVHRLRIWRNARQCHCVKPGHQYSPITSGSRQQHSITPYYAPTFHWLRWLIWAGFVRRIWRPMGETNSKGKQRIVWCPQVVIADLTWTKGYKNNKRPVQNVSVCDSKRFLWSQVWRKVQIDNESIKIWCV